MSLFQQISAESVKALKRLMAEREQRPNAASEFSLPENPPLIQQTCYAAKVTTQITAFSASGPTPGTGKVSLYRIDDDSGDLTEVETAITVYNIVNSVVNTNTWGMIQSDNWGNLWFTVEDC